MMLRFGFCRIKVKIKKMDVSILIPSRNGVEFLEWAYNSIRKNQGSHNVEILVLDDVSDKDNTWEFCEQVMRFDPMFKAFRNTTDRLGISGGFKFLAQQATQEVICHWHNDMYMTAGTLDAVENRLFSTEILHDEILENGQRSISWAKNKLPKNVVCLTRIEPPIYGEGKEKIVWKDAPIEFEDWNEDKFLKYLPIAGKQWGGKTTQGHFAPFFMFRTEYERLGGNDIVTFPLQAREDSDFAFRLKLAGYETLQIPHFVYHFASRGNRRSKHETTSYKDNPDWVKHDMKATRNFVRKWRTFNLHDEYLNPNTPVVYDIACVIENCSYNLMANLEPWFNGVQVDLPLNVVEDYIQTEQSNTSFDLWDRLNHLSSNIEDRHDVIVYIDGHRFDGDDFYYIQQLSNILTENQPEEGCEFQIGHLRLKVNRLKTYEHELIVCDNSKIEL